MAFETIDISRYVLYLFDFIFGVLSWGITADQLKLGSACRLRKSTDSGLKTESCDAVIALGVIAMLALLTIVVLRTLEVLDIFSFPEIIETITFGVLTLLWFILAVVTIAVTDSIFRSVSQVKAAIAGAWMALFTHIGSTVVSFLARTRGEKE